MSDFFLYAYWLMFGAGLVALIWLVLSNRMQDSNPDNVDAG
jgi:hypothetical protein